MASGVANSEQAAAIDMINAGFAALAEAGVAPTDARDAVTLTQELASVTTRARAAEVQALDHIERRALYRADGHVSARVMVRHVAKISHADAGRRTQVLRALREMPVVRVAFETGEIGIEQVERIARAFANGRIREALVSRQEECVRLAMTSSYREFDRILTAWCRLMDADGTADRSRACDENRDARIHQDFDGGWVGTIRCGSLDGAQFNQILRHFEDIEWKADWAEARERLDENATDFHLRRTPAQRRFDALLAMSRLAADAHAAAPGGAPIVTEIVMDKATFEEELGVLLGGERPPADLPLCPEPGSDAGPDATEGAGSRLPRQCATIDGHHIDPAEATLQALFGYIRRVVIGAAGVTINMGRIRRLFTGPAALALKIGSTTCTHPGCEVPVSRCEGDHLRPWTGRDGRPGGRTDQDNGGPRCGRHNRFREEADLTVYRDEYGGWHTLRADGTEID